MHTFKTTYNNITITISDKDKERGETRIMDALKIEGYKPWQTPVILIQYKEVKQCLNNY